jgi:hypothetical protein
MPATPADRNARTEPGTFEVAPGVYRIPLPLPSGGLLFAGDHVLPTITPSIGFEPVLAVTETAAHLQLLAAQGRVTRREGDGLRCYEPA